MEWNGKEVKDEDRHRKIWKEMERYGKKRKGMKMHGRNWNGMSRELCLVGQDRAG